MKFYFILLLLYISNNIFSQDLNFKQIKEWNNSDYFAETMFENYWSVNQSGKFFIKAN